MIGKLILLYRSVNQISVRDMGNTIGISAATISRIENGGNVDALTMLKLINWLFGEKR